VKSASLALVGVAIALTLAGGCATTQLKPGDLAPPFDVPSTANEHERLADHAGHSVVLAFFPMAFTPG
jgi:hypothetical protein